jgi:hypothetical protein
MPAMLTGYNKGKLVLVDLSSVLTAEDQIVSVESKLIRAHRFGRSNLDDLDRDGEPATDAVCAKRRTSREHRKKKECSEKSKPSEQNGWVETNTIKNSPSRVSVAAQLEGNEPTVPDILTTTAKSLVDQTNGIQPDSPFKSAPQKIHTENFAMVRGTDSKGIVLNTNGAGISYIPEEVQSKAISYGVIASTVIGGLRHFLITKKRNTYEYVALLRGVWHDFSDAKNLFAKCTKKEQRMLKTCSFDSLWKDLWVWDGCLQLTCATRARKKFAQFQGRLSKLATMTTCGKCVWEFPKGKKQLGETELECALREFQEETKIPAQELKRPILSYVTEQHIGTDGNEYEAMYYIIGMTKAYIPPMQVRTSIRKSLSEETKKCKWVTFKECKVLLGCRGGGSWVRNLESLDDRLD